MSNCVNGHNMSPSDSFCGICGGSIAGTSGVGTPEISHSLGQNFPQPTTFEAAPKQASKLPIILIAIVVLIGAGFLISKGTKPTTHNVTFTLKVYDEVGCNLGWGYSNVFGMDIDLDLDGDPFDSESLPSMGYSGSLDECILSTTFYDVPEGKSNYSFDSIRGTMEYSESEMSSNDWEVNVSLGLN